MYSFKNLLSLSRLKTPYQLPFFALLFITLFAACSQTNLASNSSLSLSPETTTVTIGGNAVSFTATLEGSTEVITWTLTGEGSLDTNAGETVVYTPPLNGSAGLAELTVSAANLSKTAIITINEAESEAPREPEEPTAAIALSHTASFTVSAGRDIEIPVTIERTNFTGSISLSLTDLIEGLSSQTVTTSSDNATLLLATTAAVAPGTYPIKVLGFASGVNTESSFNLIVEEATDQPVVERIAQADVAEIPEGLKMSCFDAGDTFSSDGNCPVLKWKGISYWAFSHLDNRLGMTVVAFNEANEIVNQWEKTGARYLWKIEVDKLEEKITLFGQGDRTILFTWDELNLEAD